MAREIERKFLVRHDGWRAKVMRRDRFRQGYLATNERCSLRVRVAGDTACLNIKSATLGVSRMEFDYIIPVSDADEILEVLCMRPFIEKIRHYVDYGRHTWEIDEFAGDNEGLVVAEIELADADEPFDRPDWLGDEVSDDPRYYNVCLVEHPYKQW